MSNSSIDCGTSSVIFYLKVRYKYDCKTTYVLPTETITIRIRRHLWSLLTKRSPAAPMLPTGKMVRFSTKSKFGVDCLNLGQDLDHLKSSWNRFDRVSNLRKKFLARTFPQLTPLNLMKRVVKKTKYPDAANILTSQQFPKNANFVHILCLFRVIFI